MEDLHILSIGRQFIEFSIQREQLYRQILALQAEQEALRTKLKEFEDKAKEAKSGANKPVGVPKNLALVRREETKED